MLSENFSINRKSNTWIKFFSGTIVLIVLIAVFNLFSAGIKNSLYAMSSPMQKTFWTAGETSSGFLGNFFNAGFIAKENQNLKQENEKLLAQVASLEAIKEANNAQSTVSLSCQNNEFNLLMVGVVGLDEQDMLSINKGSADGVQEGMPVISQNKALFGKVFKVYKNFSQVMLISNKNSVINVRVQQDDASAPEVDGAIKGLGNKNVFLDLVPVDDIIKDGDVLATSSLEASVPKGLLVGKITKIDKNDQKPYQQAEVKPFFNISTDNLFVITNYKQAQ